MSDIQQQLLDQATELVQTLTNALSSGGDLSSDMESKIDERVDEVIDEKINDAISNSHEIPDEYKVKEWAQEEVSEIDWYSVISDNDIATESWLDERVDERFDELIDDKLFTFMQDIMMKVFAYENNRWIERIKQAGVNEHLELPKKEEAQATEQLNQEVTV